MRNKLSHLLITRFFLLTAYCLLLATFISAQETRNPRYDTDLLSPDFHKGRREALRQMMSDNSVAVFFSQPVRNRTNDVDFQYSQDKNFYYLTGLEESNAALIIFKSDVKMDSITTNELLFVQPRDASQEVWTGRRFGTEGAKKFLGFKYIYTTDEFSKVAVPYKNFSSILVLSYFKDVMDEWSNADVEKMIQHLEEQCGLDEDDDYNLSAAGWYEQISESDFKSFQDEIKPSLQAYALYDASLRNDGLIQKFLACTKESDYNKLKKEIPHSKLDGTKLESYLTELRQNKSPEELALMQKAIDITGVAHTEVMKSLKPELYEYQIQSLLEFVFKQYGSEYPGFPSIVGSGENSCILHYESNRKQAKDGDMMVVDIGAEYHGYTADVTRTYPVNGKFSAEQKIIYELVWKAQQTGFDACKPRNNFRAPHQEAVKIIQDGLLELGIIKDKKDYRKYFMHGTSHYLGLDVHDSGEGGLLKENDVITVEPGIYIAAGSDCDPKWWNIGVRIEDDVLITKDGHRIMSDYAPRTVAEIEKLMSEKGLLDNYFLPELK